MSKVQPTLRQQRELLQLQADVLRLRIVAAQMKKRRGDAGINWQQFWGVLDILPLGNLALGAVSRSKRWRDKAFMAVTMVGLAWWRSRQR